MKVAFCYSGMIRDFINNIDNHKQYLLSHYDSDVYLHLWDVYGDYVGFNISNNNGLVVSFLNDTPIDYNTNYISEQDKNIIINELKPVKYCFESYLNMAPIFEERALKVIKDPSLPPNMNNMISMAYKIKQCGEMVNEGQYDLVVKLRPDIGFYDHINLSNPTPNTIFGNEYFCWQDDNVSDVFLYGNYESMKCLNTLYYEIENIFEKMGQAYCTPETSMYKHITNNGNSIIKQPIYYRLTNRKS